MSEELRDRSEERAAVAIEALSWRGTPFHWGARVKGARGGVDCGTFIAGVYEAAGIFRVDPAEFKLQAEDLQPGTPQKVGDPINPSWHLHASSDLYLRRMLKHATEITLAHMHEIDRSVLEGDLAMTKLGSYFAHCGIVLHWPMIVHCHGSGVHRVNANNDPMWRGQEIRFFSPWGKS